VVGLVAGLSDAKLEGVEPSGDSTQLVKDLGESPLVADEILDVLVLVRESTESLWAAAGFTSSVISARDEILDVLVRESERTESLWAAMGFKGSVRSARDEILEVLTRLSTRSSSLAPSAISASEVRLLVLARTCPLRSEVSAASERGSGRAVFAKRERCSVGGLGAGLLMTRGGIGILISSADPDRVIGRKGGEFPS